ncbi:hypothetical protein YC2023_010775 [Brassica napus]
MSLSTPPRGGLLFPFLPSVKFIASRKYSIFLRSSSVVSGVLVLLRVECDKFGAAPCESCLRTLVEGIKPFVVRPGVEILKTCFPVRPLRSSLYVV